MGIHVPHIKFGENELFTHFSETWQLGGPEFFVLSSVFLNRREQSDRTDLNSPIERGEKFQA